MNMNTSRGDMWKWLTLLIIAVFSFYVTTPVKDKMRFGLDLKGGTSFTLGVDTEKLRETIIASNPELTNEVGAVEREVAEITARPLTHFTGSIPRITHDSVKAAVCDCFNECLAEKAQDMQAKGIDIKEVERIVLLRSVDSHWMDHIDAMDQLKQGIGLRAYAQKDPLVAYTNEGFEMFDAMVAEIREQTVKSIMRVQVQKAPMERKQIAKPIEPAGEAGNTPVVRKSTDKVGRNDPCPCGSGKKYKNCCGRDR